MVVCHLHLFLAEEVGWPLFPAVFALVGLAELSESWSFSIGPSSFLSPRRGCLRLRQGRGVQFSVATGLEGNLTVFKELLG